MGTSVDTLRHALGGAPSVTVFHGDSEEDPVHRTFIRDSRLGVDWSSGVGDLTEVELCRGKILARELVGAGRAMFSAQGKLQVPNGASGDIWLRLYTLGHVDDTTRNPAIAKASMSLALIHAVPIAAPGAPAGQGILQWDFTMLPLGVGSFGSSQNWYSRVLYQRSSGDALNTHEATGQINIDVHQDMTWLFTMQKNVGGGTFINTLLDVYSQDGVVRNGDDGAA